MNKRKYLCECTNKSLKTERPLFYTAVIDFDEVENANRTDECILYNSVKAAKTEETEGPTFGCRRSENENKIITFNSTQTL